MLEGVYECGAVAFFVSGCLRVYEQGAVAFFVSGCLRVCMSRVQLLGNFEEEICMEAFLFKLTSVLLYM
jgi:hypothetical protein